MALEPEDSGPDPEEEGGGPIKSFLEHLEDLRWVLIKSGASLVLGMATCFAAAPKLVWILQWPLINSGTPIDLEWIGPMGAIVSTMKLAMYGGLIVAMPLILYFVGDFVVPALKRREKKYFLRAVMVGGGLFLGGVLFCYFFVLKISLLGMYQFTKWVGLPTNFWRAEEYFQFVTVLMLGMGLSFELPVIVLTLVKLGLMSHEFWSKAAAIF